jgi:hypothetical protein
VLTAAEGHEDSGTSLTLDGRADDDPDIGRGTLEDRSELVRQPVRESGWSIDQDELDGVCRSQADEIAHHVLGGECGDAGRDRDRRSPCIQRRHFVLELPGIRQEAGDDHLPCRGPRERRRDAQERVESSLDRGKHEDSSIRLCEGLDRDRLPADREWARASGSRARGRAARAWARYRTSRPASHGLDGRRRAPPPACPIGTARA